MSEKSSIKLDTPLWKFKRWYARPSAAHSFCYAVLPHGGLFDPEQVSELSKVFKYAAKLAEEDPSITLFQRRLDFDTYYIARRLNPREQQALASIAER